MTEGRFDKFRTQDVPLTGHVCYTFTLPNVAWFIREWFGALSEMLQEGNWEQAGTVSIEAAVNAAESAYWSALKMIGMIIPIATSTLPSNVLLCDGRTLARVDYPELYLALDDAFIVDGDYLKLPDLRGRAVIGAGEGTGLSERLVGDTGGEESHVLSGGEMPVHSHLDSGHIHSIHSHITLPVVAPGELPVSCPNPLPESTSGGNAAIGNAGGDTAHNNMPPFIAIKWGIVAW